MRGADVLAQPALGSDLHRVVLIAVKVGHFGQVRTGKRQHRVYRVNRIRSHRGVCTGLGGVGRHHRSEGVDLSLHGIQPCDNVAELDAVAAGVVHIMRIVGESAHIRRHRRERGAGDIARIVREGAHICGHGRNRRLVGQVVVVPAEKHRFVS